MAVNLKGKKTSLGEDASIYTKRSDDMPERERIRNMSARERLAHFNTYYLPKLLVVLAVAAAVFYIIYVDFIKKADVYMHCAILNESADEDSLREMSDRFTEYLNMDSSKNRAAFAIYYTRPDMAAELGRNAGNDLSEISSRLVSSMLDAMIASPADVEQSYLKNGFIMDLRTFLPDDEYSRLSDYLYVPSTEGYDNGDAYGIRIAESPRYRDLFAGREPLQEDPVFFIITNSTEEGREYARRFIRYLFP